MVELKAIQVHAWYTGALIGMEKRTRLRELSQKSGLPMQVNTNRCMPMSGICGSGGVRRIVNNVFKVYYTAGLEDLIVFILMSY